MKNKSLVLLLFIIYLFELNAQEYITKEDRVYNLSKIWCEVKYNYPYFDRLNTLNWDSLYTEYIEKVIEEDNPVNYYKLLCEFTAVLNDAHTEVRIPSQYMDRNQASLYIKTQYLGGEFIVCDVGEKLKEIIPVESSLIEINGLHPMEYIYKYIAPTISCYSDYSLINRSCFELFKGKIGDTIFARFVTVEKDTILKSLPIEYTKDKWAYKYRIMTTSSFKWHQIDDDITYINFGRNLSSDVSDTLHKLLSQIESKGIIFDLRGSFGGTSISQLVLDYFTDSAQYYINNYSTLINNSYYKALGGLAGLSDTNKAYNKYKPYYEGSYFEMKRDLAINHFPKKKFNSSIPIVILTNWTVVSATEDFYISLKDINANVEVVGTPTMGSAVLPITFPLIGGGQLRIASIKRYFANGEEFHYIDPDYLLEPTVKEGLNGNDKVLQKAVEVLKNKI